MECLNRQLVGGDLEDLYQTYFIMQSRILHDSRYLNEHTRNQCGYIMNRAIALFFNILTLYPLRAKLRVILPDKLLIVATSYREKLRYEEGQKERKTPWILRYRTWRAAIWGIFTAGRLRTRAPLVLWNWVHNRGDVKPASEPSVAS